MSYGIGYRNPATIADPAQASRVQQQIYAERREYRMVLKKPRGRAHVVSAGNDGRSASFHFPSALSEPESEDEREEETYRRIVSVAAVGTGYRADGADTDADVRASFSNFGPAVDIAAPGEAVLSANTKLTGPRDACKSFTLPAASPYDLFCGTSAAAPLVSGQPPC
jgi:subtilisin family serine protease